MVQVLNRYFPIGNNISSVAQCKVVPRARLGGQTTTNVLVSALVSDCTNVLAKCRSILPKVLLLKSS